MAKGQAGKLTSWQNGKLAKWQVGKMASWQNGVAPKKLEDEVDGGWGASSGLLSSYGIDDQLMKPVVNKTILTTKLACSTRVGFGAFAIKCFTVLIISSKHRHLSNIDCLSFVMCPLLVPVLIVNRLLFFFFYCGCLQNY